MMGKDIEKKIIELPSLPNVVQGDGRQLMSLLKAFLAQTAEQVNIANGFTAEEIFPDNDSEVQTPRNFTMLFNRFGCELKWDHIRNIDNLFYYEVREDMLIGTGNGVILERTISNTSLKIPVKSSGVIYLYAISKSGKYSNPSKLIYNKPRPEAPKDISLIKNNEGTLITFLEIPLNCIGANIYIDGVKFVVNDNIFLYKHEDKEKIERVEIAYYDNFGEGERGVIQCLIPRVAGFIAERNGSNVDFYWDSINLFGVQYAVKVATEASWNKAIDCFKTKLTRHSIVYPNSGNLCFLIKAFDEHNNYSTEASFVYLDSAPDISKNVILEYKQQDVGYSGNKINLYYDALAQGLKLEKDSTIGEYIASIELPQRYRARSWAEYKVIGVTNESPLWIDMDFAIDSERAANTTCLGGVFGDINGTTVKQQIARHIGLESGNIDGIEFNNSLITSRNKTPIEKVKATTYKKSRWANGIYIDDLTRLAYDISNISEYFNIVFWLKKTQKLEDCIILTLKNEASFLMLGYDVLRESFYLRDNNQNEISVVMKELPERDWLMFGVVQTATERRLYIYSFGRNMAVKSEGEALSMGILNQVYFYPEF